MVYWLSLVNFDNTQIFSSKNTFKKFEDSIKILIFLISNDAIYAF